MDLQAYCGMSEATYMCFVPCMCHIPLLRKDPVTRQLLLDMGVCEEEAGLLLDKKHAAGTEQLHKASDRRMGD